MKKALSLLIAAILTATFCGCNKPAGHQHQYTKKSMEDKYLASEVNCLTGRLYFYVCEECGEAGDYVWVAGDALGHDLKAEGCSRCEWKSVDHGTLESGHEWAYYSDGTLYMFGSGALPDWTEEQLLSREIPWAAHPVRSIVLQKGITAIGDRSFAGLTRLTTVTFPYGVTSIGTSAFEGCTKLTDPVLPETLNTVDKNAFRSCTSIQNITLPKYTVYMDGNIFAGCSALENITVSEGNTAFTVQNGCLIESSTATLVVGTKTAQIPTDGSVHIIGESAFEDCIGLTALHLPASITTIKEGAFNGCSAITSISVDPDNPSYSAPGNCLIENATKRLIQGCAASRLPEDGSVEEIADYAFAGCKDLKALHLPASVSKISSSAFIGCTSLETITAAEGNPQFHAINNCLIISGTRTLLLGCKTSVIPTDGSVTRIGNGAFAGTTITELILPDEITEIGESAFEDCKELKKITFGKGITTFDAKAFLGCNALETFSIAEDHPNFTIIYGSLIDTATKTLLLGTNKSEAPRDGTVTSIAPYAYAGRTEVTDYYIPTAVTTVGEGAFYGCSKLKSIWYQGSPAEWEKLDLGSAWSAFTASGLLINYNAT